MNARNSNKRHILFGMLIMTLGMSKSWMLTANEDFGSAELAQTAPSKSRKDRAKELNRDENKTGQNGKLAAASTSSTPSANLKRLKPKDDFKSDRPAPKTKDDTKSDDSDDSANSKTTVKAKTSSNSKGTVIDVDDPDGIKVILDPPTSSSSQVDSEGKPILVRTFKVVDKNGKTIDTGKTTIKSSNEKMNTFENGQLVAGKDKTITVAVTTIENCNCESIQDVSGFAGELEMFNSITSHIRNQQIAFAKAAIEAAKKKKEEEEKLAKQKEEEDEEKARVDKLVSECKARRSGDEVIDLTKDKKYLYSQSHMFMSSSTVQ